ncbi:MAG: hypothetical protein SOY62_09905 [Streptococcus orisratti]|nr:hypothetical protein [Streptococcus orisratti]
MRKHLILFLILITTITSMVIMTISVTNAVNSFLYNGKTTISIIPNGELSDDEIVTNLTTISKKTGINFYRTIHKSDAALDIFTTDFTLSNNVNLYKGRYPETSSNSFISNIITNNSKQSGTFHFLDKKMKLSVFSLKELRSMGGYIGIYEIDTSDSDKIDTLIHELKKSVGSSEVYGYNQLSYVDCIVTYFEQFEALFVSLLLLFFIYVYVLLNYIISIKKEIALRQLFGYKFSEILYFLTTKYLSSVIISLGISSLILLLLHRYFISTFYIGYFLLVNIIIHISLLLLMLLLTFLVIFIQSKVYKMNDILKGKVPFYILLSYQIFMKLSVLVLLIVSLTGLKQDEMSLGTSLKNSVNWEKTENMYVINAKFVTNNLKVRRPIEINSAALFQELEKNVGLIMINASNYDKLLSGEYLYEANTAKGTDRYSFYGTTIKVNPNYLKKHPIKSNDNPNVDVTELLIYHSNTLNILVPESLKKYEGEIIDNFKSGFYFAKVKVANIYHQKFNEPDEQIQAEDLRINIIYVRDNEQYFTYNPDIARESHNLIKNPIVIVDTGVFDYSFYYSALTSNTFYYSDKVEPLQEILPYVAKYNLLSSYNSVTSIYDFMANNISVLKKKVRMLRFVEVLLSATLIYSTLAFYSTYYERYKYDIHVKSLLGYSRWSHFKVPILINLLSVTVLCLVFNISSIIKIGLLISEILIGIFYLAVLLKYDFRSLSNKEL